MCASISVGLLALLVGGCLIHWKLEKQKLIELKENLFERNGVLQLQKILSNHQGSMEITKICSAELEKSPSTIILRVDSLDKEAMLQSIQEFTR